MSMPLKQSQLQSSSGQFGLSGQKNSSQVDYLPLVSIVNGQLMPCKEGIVILEDQCFASRTILICISGATSYLPYQLYKCPPPKFQHQSSGIWIASLPRMVTASESYIYLKMEGNDAEDEAKLHLLVSLICTVVMVNYQGNSLRFLAGNRNKFLGDAKEIDQCLAYLLILERTVGENRGNSALQPKVDLYTLFTQNKLYQQGVHIGSDAQQSQLPNDPTVSQIQSLQKQLLKLSQKHQGKIIQLSAGPVLAQYLTILCTYFNKNKQLSLSDIHNKIQIPQGYYAYLQSVQAYHMYLSNNLKQQQENINIVLQQGQHVAIVTYNQISNDAGYLSRLEQYMQRRENQLETEYNKKQNLVNINWLKNKTDQLMMRVDKAVPVLSSSAIGEEVNKLVKQYKKEAKGEDRYELLTNYLDLLVPALLKTAEKSSLKSGEEELEKYRAENMELTRRLANQRAIGQQRQQQRNQNCCAVM